MSQHELSAAVGDRAQRPRNYGPVFPCDGHARITGPCGDTMEFWEQEGEVKATAWARFVERRAADRLLQGHNS